MSSTPMSQVVRQATRQLLHEVALTSHDRVLREVVEEVLAGRVTWSEAMRLSAYREAAEDAVARTLAGAERLGQDFVTRCESAAQQYLDTYARERGVTIADRPDRLVELRREPPP